MPIGCIQSLQCAIGCVDVNAVPPTFSAVCIANCVAETCADAQVFVNQTLTCAVTNFAVCGTDFNCIQKACSSQIAACIGATCAQ
jgi:hypothetical protein